jgi:hypothetical protein
MFQRGLSAGWKGVKGAAKGAWNSLTSGDPYDTNKRKEDLFGNMGLDKIDLTNQGKIDSKNIDKRLKQVQSRLKNDITGKAQGTYDKLLDHWSKVKPALISYPEKNQEWRNYINNQLAELENMVGLKPDPKLARNPGMIDINTLTSAGGRQTRVPTTVRR